MPNMIVTMRVDCPLNPATGKPETMFGRIMAGKADIHAVQYALRARADAMDAATAARYLASAHIRR